MTILLEIAVVAAIVFGVVAFALGRVDGMRPAPPDTGEIGVADGPVTADAIERTRFGLSFRGYRMGEVDAVLDRLRDDLARRDGDLDESADDSSGDTEHVRGPEGVTEPEPVGDTEDVPEAEQADEGAERLGEARTWPS